MLKQFKKFFSQKADSLTEPENAPITVPSPVNWERIYRKLNNQYNRHITDSALIEIVETNAEVRSVVDYNANLCASIEWRLINTRSKRSLDSHPVLDLLYTPNPKESKYDFMKKHISYYLTCGRAYINTVHPEISEFPLEMWNLANHKLQPIVNNLIDFRTPDRIQEYIYTDGVILQLLPKDVLCRKDTNLRDIDEISFSNTSRLASAIMCCRSLRAAYQAKVTLLSHRGSMGVLSPDGREEELFTPDELDILYRKFYERFGLESDQAQILISQKPVKYSQMAIPIAELQLRENILADLQSICRVFQTPSVLLNDPTSAKFDNLSAARRLMYTTNIQPAMYSLAYDFEKHFQLSKRNLSLEPVFDDIPELQPDKLSLNKVLEIQRKCGVITRNEWREAVGLEKSTDPEMDLFDVPKPNSTGEQNENNQTQNQHEQV